MGFGSYVRFLGSLNIRLEMSPHMRGAEWKYRAKGWIRGHISSQLSLSGDREDVIQTSD